MSVKGINEITSKFKERWLSPLQFPGSHRTVEQRLDDLENAKKGVQPANSRIKIRVKGQKSPASQVDAPNSPIHSNVRVARPQEGDTSSHARVMSRESLRSAPPKPGTDEHFDHVMARSAALLNRTSYAAGNVEAASHAQRMKRSGDILQNIRNTAEEHSQWGNNIREAQARLSTPAAAPQRSTQYGLFPKGDVQVTSQHQFGLAAKAAPAQAAPSAPRKPRVTQPGLFPKSAVSPAKKAAPAPSAPAAPAVSDADWHSMLTDSIAERKQAKKPKKAPAPGQNPLF